jgi:hypothetical protein
MAHTAHNTAVRTTAVITIGALALLGLSGCKNTANSPASSSSPSPSATPSSSASARPDAAPSATPVPTRAAGTPLSVSCSTLLTPQTVYDFNQNTSLQPAYKPKSGSDGSSALSFNGISCGLVNNSSGAITSVSAAHPSASDLAALKSAAAKGTAVSGLGDAAWFSTSGQNGQLQVFTGPYWVTASSVFFGTAEDARQLAGAALAAVK